ncbi:aspartyl protease family protein [Bradyrhizobium sp. 2TAF24]|uniref:aspartyl protease family protein n=1 Tax=Bradyrhizobium sp. 2TAF24 TaxID=3233011 RepID=UPI003F908886
MARADVRPEDLPPPPGALERDLGQRATAKTAPAVPGNATSLSEPNEIPFILEESHIIIPVSIDGGPARPFLFDTGGQLVITREFAASIKMQSLRTAHVGGVGAKVLHADIVKIGRVTVGAATLEQATARVLELPNIIVDRGSRPRLAGLIGAELLAHYAVSIDYERRVLTLNAPGFRPSAPLFTLPLGLAMSPDGLSHPSISAELDGVTGDFLIDTGANGQIVLSEKFQREHQPYAGKTLHFLTPGGVGGRAHMRLGFGRQFRIGTSSLPLPLVAGIDPGGSSLSRSPLAHVAGVIGHGVLSRFVVTVDRPSGRVYFEAAADHPRPPSLYGTGAILDKPDHDAFEVIDILSNTAAERAGLRRGDRIVEIGGRAARDLGITDVHMSARTAMRGVTLRTSDQRQFDLTFSPLLP